MSGDVIIGYDGRGRCAWAGTGDTALGRYHDEVWGARTYDEPGMFEALTLGVFEVGLSWSISLDGHHLSRHRHRPGRHRKLHDPARVALS